MQAVQFVDAVTLIRELEDGRSSSSKTYHAARSWRPFSYESHGCRQGARRAAPDSQPANKEQECRATSYSPFGHRLRGRIIAVPLAVELQQGVAAGRRAVGAASAVFGADQARQTVEHEVEVLLRVLLADAGERLAVRRRSGSCPGTTARRGSSASPSSSWRTRGRPCARRSASAGAGALQVVRRPRPGPPST